MAKGGGLKSRRIVIGFAMSVGLYLLCLLLFSFAASKGWIDERGMLVSATIASALASACGTVYITRQGNVGALPAALIAGPLAMSLMLTLGWTFYEKGFRFTDGRWSLIVAALISGLLVGLLPRKKRGKTGRKKYAKR